MTQAGPAFDEETYVEAIPKLFEHIRVKHGKEVKLIHDVHEHLSPTMAVELARRMEPYRMFYVEDILPPELVQWFRNIKQVTSTPLAIESPRFGGIRPARKVAALCETFGVRTAWHEDGDNDPVNFAAACQIDLASSAFGIQEDNRWPELVHEMLPGTPKLPDGYAYVNEAPGSASISTRRWRASIRWNRRRAARTASRQSGHEDRGGTGSRRRAARGGDRAMGCIRAGAASRWSARRTRPGGSKAATRLAPSTDYFKRSAYLLRFDEAPSNRYVILKFLDRGLGLIAMPPGVPEFRQWGPARVNSGRLRRAVFHYGADAPARIRVEGLDHLGAVIVETDRGSSNRLLARSRGQAPDEHGVPGGSDTALHGVAHRSVAIPQRGGIEPEAGEHFRSKEAVRIRRKFAVLAAEELAPHDAPGFQQNRQVFTHASATVKVELDAEVA